MSYLDLMLDLETFDSDPNATIIAIGAVAFDRDGWDTLATLRGAPERNFYTTVDTWEQGTHGRTMSADTVLWWMKQTEEARKHVTQPGLKLGPSLKLLTAFAQEHGIQRLWGYGATFDNVVIAQAYKAYGLKAPVPYRGHRCARTIIADAGVQCPEDKDCVPHHALHDAQRQVVWLQQAYRSLTNNPV